MLNYYNENDPYDVLQLDARLLKTFFLTVPDQEVEHYQIETMLIFQQLQETLPQWGKISLKDESYFNLPKGLDDEMFHIVYFAPEAVALGAPLLPGTPIQTKMVMVPLSEFSFDSVTYEMLAI